MPDPTGAVGLNATTGKRGGRVASPAAMLIAMLAALLAWGAITAPPASAHDQLISSTPAPGDELPNAPTALHLTFSAELLTIGPMVVLQDAAGTTWPTGEPQIDGPEVTSTVADALPAGSYSLNWRVVSSDGHPISGTVPFTIAGAPAAVPDTQAAAPVAPAAHPTASTGATAPASGSEAQPASAPSQPWGDPFGPWRVPLIGLGGAVLAVAILLVVRRVRARRHLIASERAPE